MIVLLSLIVMGLICFVVYLERRLSKVEAWAEFHAGSVVQSAEELPEETWTPQPAEEIAPVEDEAEAAPQSTILYAETRDHDPPVEDDRIEAVEAPKPRFALSIEDLFGRRLPIWAGGITLAVAGFFIVKLSIEAGLLSPPIRVMGGMLFGAVLIAGAEVALRYHERVGDDRVRQALSGAGLASLYASILVAANLYHLVPAVIAMFGVAAVTGLAMFLSIRFGAPSALLGLAGGLSAPALIGSTEPNVPLLSLYLAFAVGGLAVLSRNQRWAWLGISALIGGFGWGALLLMGGALDLSGSIAVGMYLLLLGIGLPLLGLAGDRNDRLQLVAGIAAAAQMAALVATGGFTLLNWGLFGTIAAATVWLATREPKLDRLPAVGLVIGLLLAAAWPDPQWRSFALVLGGILLIQAPVPVRRLWTEKGGLLDAAQIAAIGLGAWLVSMLHFHRAENGNDMVLGLFALGLAVATAVVAAAGWRFPERRDDSRFAIVTTSAAILLAGAFTLLLPDWSYGVAIAAVGLGLLHLGQQAEDPRLEPLGWIFGAGGFIACFTPEALLENTRTIDSVRFVMIALVGAAFAWRGRYLWPRVVAQFLAAAFVYFAIALWIDDRYEPAVAGLILLAAAAIGTRLRGERLMPAMGAAALIVAYWAIAPFYRWADAGAASLVAQPFLVSAVPTIQSAIERLLIPAALTAGALWLAYPRLRIWERMSLGGLAAIAAGVGAHSLYKHVFTIDGVSAFIADGLAERTIWEALFFGGAIAAVAFRRRPVALCLAGVALLHFALYTLLLHNPLWSAQSVGQLPLVNLLLPAYGLPLLALFALGKSDGAEEEWTRRMLTLAQIALIVLLAFSQLRQLFHGALLVDPGVSQAEDIARSVLAIALAVGFLLWGIWREDRDWRIASLALMLAAVGKVFLFDASGLEGVTRIASFVALGFSLIGIGWLYSLYLPARQPQVAKAGSSR
ncbi:MAG TPA: DUF2339 domain-containing protein [Sphingomicrobium sp.]